MNILTKKLLRTIWRTKGQFLAIAAVITIGLSVYISMATVYSNLSISIDSFYHENNFADYSFHLVRAPQEITKQIAALDGVERVTGRIQKDLTLMLPDGQRGSVRLTSYPLPMDQEVNRLQLLTGRIFEQNAPGGRIEVLIDPQHAQARALSFNDAITVIIDGKQIALTMVGTATSPEFIYPLPDLTTLMPTPETFAIVMIAHRQAEQILGLTGQINQVVLTFTAGADEEKIAGQVKDILEPYGNLANYPRQDQLSHAILKSELDGLRIMAQFLPVIFLGVAAAVQFIMLNRIVKSQRLQIGIMKALGYSGWRVMWHYTSYALAVALLGVLAGTGLGLWFATMMTQIYAQFFNLPQAIEQVNLQVISYALLFSTAVSIIAGLIAARSIVAINPAEAMHPEPPKKGRHIALERWQWLWQRLDSTWKMSLRTAMRNKVRFGITLLGIIFSVGLLIVAFFFNDSVDYMIQEHFYEGQHFDYLIRFDSPLKAAELLNVNRIDGILKSEPFFELPVRLHFNHQSEETLLLGLLPDGTLRTISDQYGNVIPLPEKGLIIAQRTADELAIQTGDTVTVETLLGRGAIHHTDVKIAGISRQFIGSESYISLQQLNRILQEQQLISGAMLKIDTGQAQTIENSLKEFVNIASIVDLQKELEGIYQQMDMMIYFTGTMVIFAVVLGFAIIYNVSLISFEERKRELSLLRLLGFKNNEISSLLLKENFLQSVLGIALGLPFGYLMALSYVRALETDLFTFPMAVYPTTYFLAALGGVFFITVAYLLARRRVKRLNLIETLKNKD
ncbi:MAG: ABC transporter permease [Desulfotomaculum sp.]|nr:ABC transporter permease [Desulfotomaculum sp.]